MTWQPPCSATGRGASGFSFVLRFMTERSYDLACSSFQHAVRGSLARTGVRPVHPRRCRLPQMLPGRRHSCNSSYQNRLDSFERSWRSTKDDASCLIKHHVIGSAMWVPKPGCCSLSRLRVQKWKIIAETRLDTNIGTLSANSPTRAPERLSNILHLGSCTCVHEHVMTHCVHVLCTCIVYTRML